MEVNYEELYHQLYSNVAYMLVENKTKHYSPEVLLIIWDSIRDLPLDKKDKQ